MQTGLANDGDADQLLFIGWWKGQVLDGDQNYVAMRPYDLKEEENQT